MNTARFLCLALVAFLFLSVGCHRQGTMVRRSGDEIMVAGQLFHTGAPVVMWTDPGGYDAYRTERRFAPWDKASYNATTQEAADLAKEGRKVPFEIDSPNRFAVRHQQLDAQTLERVRGGGWDLKTVQENVDQFVYHYDVTGASRQTHKILHDIRDLSVQFMLDTDGTIYQTMDLKDGAWHATKSNFRSIGIEIANIGAYPVNDKDQTLDQWYRKDEKGQTRMVLPAFMAKTSGIRTPNFVAHPARNEPVVGTIQGKQLRMYDLTPQQYDSLIKLTATVCTVLPKINCDAPRDASGKIIDHALTDEQWANYQGLMGHFHVQTNKTDPGPAFDWNKLISGARKLMSGKALKANKTMLGHPVKKFPSTQPFTIH
ncbi:MAG TPA: N-acetylmuramoyl-L-alanine amidase [Tepidisphaeraceae bacterium]|nr:N-acetylmuramoyl-L-alanine amidase [Tepidisphaeraceae bacterium]